MGSLEAGKGERDPNDTDDFDFGRTSSSSSSSSSSSESLGVRFWPPLYPVTLYGKAGRKHKPSWSLRSTRPHPKTGIGLVRLKRSVLISSGNACGQNQQAKSPTPFKAAKFQCVCYAARPLCHQRAAHP